MEIESILLGIWKNVLETNDIDVNDQFLWLGGNSFKALRVMVEIEKHFLVKLPATTIFRYDTITKLANYLEDKINKDKKLEVRRKENNQKIFSLTQAQRNFYFIYQYQQSYAYVYNVPLILELNGTLNYQLLVNSLEYLIERHEILRTIFYEIPKEKAIVQEIVGKENINLQLSIENIEYEEVNQKIRIEINQFIALNQFPLIRIKLFKLQENKHILVITQPHIITDGWSINILKNELFQHYNFLVNQTFSDWLIPGKSYFDYIENELSEKRIEINSLDMSYWKSKLENFRPTTFPYDFKRLRQENFSGKRLSFSIEQVLFQKIQAFSATYNVTPFIFVSAILNFLLSQYCRQEDITIGFVVAGRDDLAFQDTLGLFIHTLILRTEFSLDNTFIELIKEVKKNCVEAYEHPALALNALVKHLNVPREIGVNPIFQVMLVWQDWYEENLQAAENLAVKVKTVDAETAKFDLTFEFIPNQIGLTGIIEYNTELFHSKTIESLSVYFVSLIEQCLLFADRPLNKIPFNYSAKYESKCLSKEMTHLELAVYQFFEKNVHRYPAKVALKCQETTLTYAGLNKKANQLAHYVHSKLFTAKNTKPTKNVGILLGKDVDAIIAVLALSKLGVTYVSIDINAPEYRVNFIVTDADCQFVITKSIYQNKLSGAKHQLLLMDQEASEIEKQAETNLPTIADLDHAMYVIYTSGTTGQPKGVIQTHFNVSRLFQVTQPIFHFDHQDVWLWFHSLAFDFSVWEIWGALIYGGTLVIATEQDMTEPQQINQLIKTNQVTVLNQTPSAFQGLMQTYLQHFDKTLSLKYIIFGGEPLDIRRLADWWQLYGNTHPQLVNMYGITETTVHNTFKMLSQADLKRREHSNIGTPLADMNLFVVSQDLQIVPFGIPGELLVSGNGLAKGYLNQPDMTKQKFIKWQPNQRLADYKNTKYSSRVYRTGDLVRCLSDGSLEYLGRIDKQIKLRGFRIEIEEIEVVLKNYSQIKQCVVTLKPHHDVLKLVAYYVLSDAEKKAIETKVLRSHLEKHLPQYMIPHYFIRIDKVPLTQNMKVNYQALPEIREALIHVQSNDQVPETIPEDLLMHIFKKHLYVKNIGPDDNFFGMGGDSITSLQVAAEARDQGFKLAISDIFKYQTAREIAKNCWRESEVKEDSALLPFSMLSSQDQKRLPDDSEDAYPISALQLGMIYHAKRSPEDAVYLDIFSYKIAAPYQQQYLVESFMQLMKAHPILRTTFHISEYSVPIQIIHKNFIAPVYFEDLSLFNENEQNELIEKWMTQEKNKPFEVAQGPMFRMTIHLFAANKFHVGFAFHHAILDGWSMATFMTALLSIYDELLKKGQLSKLSVNAHYREFVRLEQLVLKMEAQKNFWKKELDDFNFSTLSEWTESRQAKNFDTHKFILQDDLFNKLNQLSIELNISIDVFLLAALIKLIAILTHSDDVLTGAVFNGRPPIKEIENTLGLFLNTVPFRCQLENGSWRDFLKNVSEKKTQIYPYRRYPLAQIEKDSALKQLFTTIFYFTHFHVYEAIENLNQVKIFEQTFYERTNFPLAFNCALNSLENNLKIFVNYECKYYDKASIEKITDYFCTILNTMLNNVDADHQSVDLLSPQEKQVVLYDWNQTAVDYRFDQSFYQLFEAQAQRTPHQIALIFNGENVTFEELAYQVDHFASYLSKKGAVARDFIAVYMQRNIEAMVAILSIFKLGCVYVPIDIVQPTERVNYILEECNCRFVLSQSAVIDTVNITDAYQAKILFVDNLVTETEPVMTHEIKPHIFDPQALAYVIYTSGSTGQPKGVMIKQVSLLNFLFFMQEKLNMQVNDHWLALTSFSFDISLLEILLPLITGATCVIASSEQTKDPNWIVNAIQQFRINYLQATPTTWKMLFDFGYELSSSMTVLTGGEALTKSIAAKLENAKIVWNAYGPTEATVYATYFAVSQKNVHIGKPIANMKTYVLDKYLNPVPIGVPGELYIAGLGIATGYLGKENLTKERFIVNPFEIDKTYSRMYKTGDLVKWSPSGDLEFLGRIDQQFKLRGFRMEPGDIEAALLQYPLVKESIVLVKKIEALDTLIAYIVLKKSEKLFSAKEMRGFLLKKIPHYMLPEKFVFVDAMPKTISGKTDIKKLLSLSLKQNEILENEPEITLTNQQKKIANIWAEVLAVNYVSPEDSFYDLGGNSISALIALYRMNQAFDIDLSISNFIEHPTLTEISNLISGLEGKAKMESMQKRNFSFVKDIPDPVVKLKSTGSKQPLFLIHPVGGTIFYYIPLAKYLHSDRPIYAIQDPGIMVQERLFSTLTEMALFYIKVIKSYQSSGPYYIAGSSFGANAAVEIARQLQAQNEVVAFIGLIDGWANYPNEANKNRQWFENNLKKQLQEMRTLLPNENLTNLLFDINWHRQQLVVQHHLPDHLNLKLTLFKAEETMEVLKSIESPYNHWEDYCLTPPTTYIVPGDHFTMHFEPNIGKLAKIFDDCLDLPVMQF